MVLASPNDQKYPHYPLVLRFNVILAWLLRLVILYFFFKLQFLSDDRRLNTQTSSNGSPCILKLVQKVKNRVYKMHAFLMNQYFAETLQFYLKMMCTSCADEVRGKVPSFEKVTLFL